MLDTQRELFQSMKVNSKLSNDSMAAMAQAVSRLADFVCKKEF
jgi:hypothetical protein